jgi:hypothetical protein
VSTAQAAKSAELSDACRKAIHEDKRIDGMSVHKMTFVLVNN